MTSLDFYSKIEPIIGMQEACDELYEIFLDEIYKLEFMGNDALDFGSGSGNFALKLKKDFNVICIDKSSEMVKVASSKGLDARNTSLNEVNETFDLITASFDVINYMDKKELKEFLKIISEKLNDGGYFVFDINTKFGFTDVADGLLYESDDKGNELIIDANFDNNILETTMIYFEKNGEIYKKFQQKITQYYHSEDEIKKYLSLKLLNLVDVNLYSDTKPDKKLFVFTK
ncbi:SAM-dependent methyltransferase [Campylobacter blaseri]|uniref:SAM-dependent methyltransferase n=1 Tax=Campylobacter blaseri TaxID=2042961 RepID=A0A2P8R0E9_9BACT|nr:class I SAM-dependent methyltransferase [Campylobacter blaseri]PSM51977.1 SAM-dependent methyltransferase [Campylobacter blaseri]PSM53762.1 SAM-dependent methyltransferase [Campylobacter blaseri]QKF85684.1 SAM-dependent methyltransferase [Campylobacter blaseri]